MPDGPQFPELESLCRSMDELAHRYAASAAAAPLPDLEEALQTIRDGRILIEDYPPSIDAPAALDLLLALAARVRRSTEDQNTHAALDQIARHARACEDGIHRLPESDLPEELLPLAHFLLRAALRPFLQPLAQLVQPKLDGSVYVGGNCPVCGALPFLARKPIGFDFPPGFLELHCPDCCAAWLLPETECPKCATDSPDAIQTIEPAPGSLFQLRYCIDCRHYLKERLDPEAADSPFDAPFLEDVRSLPLDFAARNHGLQPINAQLGGF